MGNIRLQTADRWEDESYLVITKLNKDIPVYTVRREDGIGKARTLHRNLLLPIGSTCVELDQDERPRRWNWQSMHPA